MMQCSNSLVYCSHAYRSWIRIRGNVSSKQSCSLVSRGRWDVVAGGGLCCVGSFKECWDACCIGNEDDWNGLQASAEGSEPLNVFV